MIKESHFCLTFYKMCEGHFVLSTDPERINFPDGFLVLFLGYFL